jgi:type I restriction enzyme R subunit
LEVSEAKTRKEVIDPRLAESGWDVKNPTKVLCEIDTKQSDFEKRDYKTFEETFANNQDKAYADYLLLDSKGDPLAVIEAKKTSRDPRLGQEQASEYAQDVKEQTGSDVFILLTNGEQIWYWNKGYESPRPVKSFPTREDLETRRYHNISKKSFADVQINRDIIERPYQLEAVKRVLEGIEKGRRKFLIVQATGTGKTRVAVALCDVLLRAHRIKRILFLADRKELRDQARDDNFKVYLPHESITTVYSESVDTNNRIYISTIQTFENIYQKFSVGFFDLIISDEAHRSIYNKWKDVFTYFDALQVGLTATPTDAIERDTFQFFDCFDGNPTYNYSIDEAISDGYLCGYWVHNTSTKFQLEGITPKDIPEEEKERLLAEGIDPEEIDVEGTALERSIIVEDTNMEIISEFMNNCVTDDAGLPAKTIIFPFNINHGRRIQEIFEKLYPEYKGELVQLISSDDSRAKALIKKFKKESFPRIAISVGILDTGVDIPEICNLLFMRQTFSRVRFWQMIGRGTRSDQACKHKEWLPNKKKEEFVIFDAWETLITLRNTQGEKKFDQ